MAAHNRTWSEMLHGGDVTHVARQNRLCDIYIVVNTWKLLHSVLVRCASWGVSNLVKKAARLPASPLRD